MRGLSSFLFCPMSAILLVSSLKSSTSLKYLKKKNSFQSLSLSPLHSYFLLFWFPLLLALDLTLISITPTLNSSSPFPQ